MERPVYTDWKHIEQAGIARADIAPTEQSPNGVPPNKFNHRMNRTVSLIPIFPRVNVTHTVLQVLQQHCDYFDLNGDGIITPLETYIALRLLNWSIFYCLFATVFIHSGLSYITLPPGHWLPDPLFRIHLDYVGSAKHGSDSGAYDNEGRFRPQLFADVFTKFGEKLDNGDYGITFKQAMKGAWGQRCVADVFGITARVAECRLRFATPSVWTERG